MRARALCAPPAQAPPQPVTMAGPGDLLGRRMEEVRSARRRAAPPAAAGEGEGQGEGARGAPFRVGCCARVVAVHAAAGTAAPRAPTRASRQTAGTCDAGSRRWLPRPLQASWRRPVRGESVAWTLCGTWRFRAAPAQNFCVNRPVARRRHALPAKGARGTPLRPRGATHVVRPPAAPIRRRPSRLACAVCASDRDGRCVRCRRAGAVVAGCVACPQLLSLPPTCALSRHRARRASLCYEILRAARVG